MKKSTRPSPQGKSPGKTATQKGGNLELVRDLTAFMKEHGIVELEVQTKDQKVRLRRQEAGVPAAAPAYSNGSAGHATAATEAPATNGNAAAAPERAKNVHVVTSPFVGTFYRASGPNQDPFVQVGQTVGAGDALCIVEAMKLMNEIESDTRGRIHKVLVENGSPVEFGEAHFEIELT